MAINALKLCLVTNIKSTPFQQYKNFLLQAIEGGITCIQLREKYKSINQLRDIAIKLKSFLEPLGIPLIINDHVNIAKEINADGVHLGQKDLAPHKARQILGPNKIIGLSIETLEELAIANQLNCIDYLGASAVFPSKSKLDCKTIWGLDGLKEITSRSKYPIIAIGGITQNNIKDIIHNGAYGVAVISAIHDHSNPKEATANLIKLIREKYA